MADPAEADDFYVLPGLAPLVAVGVDTGVDEIPRDDRGDAVRHPVRLTLVSGQLAVAENAQATADSEDEAGNSAPCEPILGALSVGGRMSIARSQERFDRRSRLERERRATRERALLLLEPRIAQALRWHEDAGLTSSEIACRIGLEAQAVNGILKEGRATMRGLKAAISKGTFDYVAWGDKQPSLIRLNPLVYFARAGVQIPSDATMAELRQLGQEHLSSLLTLPDADKAVASSIFRLDNSSFGSSDELAAHYGLSRSYLPLILKRVDRSLGSYTFKPGTSRSERESELPAEPTAALQLIRCSRRANRAAYASMSMQAEVYMTHVANRLSQDVNVVRVAGEVGAETYGDALRTIVNSIVAYNTRNGHPLEGNLDRDVAVATAYLEDIQLLGQLGFNNAQNLATYSSAREIIELSQEHAGLKPVTLRSIIMNSPRDPGNAVRCYVERVDWARATYAGNAVITDSVINELSRRYPRRFTELLIAYEQNYNVAVAHYARTPGVPAGIIRHYCNDNPPDIIEAIESWRSRRSSLAVHFSNRRDIPGWLIDNVAKLKPSRQDLPDDQYLQELTGRLDDYRQELRQLRAKYAMHPDLGDALLVRIASNHYRNPRSALDSYFKQLARLRANYGDQIDDFVLQHYASRYCRNLKSAEMAVGRWTERVTELRHRHQYSEGITDEIIKEAALMWPKNTAAGLQIMLHLRSRELGSNAVTANVYGRQKLFETPPDNPPASTGADDNRMILRQLIDEQLQQLQEHERMAVLLVFGIQTAESLGLGEAGLRQICQQLGTSDLVEYVSQKLVPLLQQEAA